MATWAKGVDFKNSNNTKRIGGIGVYGTDSTINKLYIGLGAEPWNNAGLQLTSSAINFKGNKIYHAGDKPTLSELGAAASSHTHNYAGSSSAGGSANSAVKLGTARTLTIGSTGKTFDGSANVSWSLTEIGAAAASHSHSYLPLSGGTVSGSSFGPLVIKRSDSTNAAAIVFSNTNGTLGSIGMTASKNGGLIRWTDDTSSNYTILDTGNYKSFVTPASIGAAASSHSHSYLPLSGGTLTGAITIKGSNKNLVIGTGTSDVYINNSASGKYIQMRDDGGLTYSGNKIYHAGDKPTLSELGAAAASHNHDVLISAGSRIASANIAAKGDKGLRMYLATSSMTTGKPAADGYILNFDWDTTAGWSSQMYIKNSNSPIMQIRGMNAGTWGSWYTLYSTNNKPTPAEIGAAASSHTHNYAGSSSAGGAANSANTLATARTINGTSFNGSANITTANWGTARTITIGSTGKSVNGSANVSWSLSEIGAAAASHSHSYLPLSGGTLTAPVNNSYSTSTYLAGNQGKTLINSTCGAGAYTMLYKYPSTNGYFTIGGYQGNFLLQYTAKTTVDAGTNSVTKSVTLLNESGNSSFPGTVSASSFSGALSGNASTASKLQTARTINGTSFNGSGNITTSNWGTARTVTIGNTGKSVNGSGNVSWSLSEIGAAAASHTHSYLPLSGGTLTGALKFGKAMISDSTQNDTLQVSGTGSAAMGAIKLGSGGCRIYGLGSTTKLYIEGGMYTNGDIEAGNGYVKSVNYIWGRGSDVYIEPKRGTGFSGGARFTWTGATTVGAPRYQLVPIDSVDFRVGSPEMPIHGVHGKNSYVTTSDRRAKENIQYIEDEIMLLSDLKAEKDLENILTKEDFYNFFKDEIKFSSYDMIGGNIENLETNLGFIAQEIAETKVGSKIVIPPREKIKYHNEDGTIDVEEVKNGMYAFSTGNFASAIAIALQKAIEKIEAKNKEISQLKEELYLIKEKLGL